MTILAQDSFVRANQTGFGTASDGNVWAAAGATWQPNIQNNEGLYSGLDGKCYSALGSGSVSTVNVLSVCRSSSLTGFIGPAIRLDMLNLNGYCALLDNSGNAQIDRIDAGVHTTIAFGSVTGWVQGDKWNIRLIGDGSLISASFWKYGAAEPATAQFTITDSTYASGQYGMVSSLQSSTATVSEIVITDSPNVGGGVGLDPIIYGTAVLDAMLTTASVMTTATGGTETSKVTANTSAAGNFMEVLSQGGTIANVSAIPATPSGKGWVYKPGAGTFSAGAWSAVITLANTTAAGSWTLRFFKYSGGTYALIGTIPSSISATAKTTYNFGATAMAATTFAASDLLYIDLWYEDTSGAGGDTVTVYESTTATAGVASDMQVTTANFVTATVPANPHWPRPRWIMRPIVGGIFTPFQRVQAWVERPLTAPFVRPTAPYTIGRYIRRSLTNLLINYWLDIPTRFRLRSADQLRDISARFVLGTGATNVRDIASRLRLMSANQLKDISARLRLMSASSFSDIATRLRLRSSDKLRDIATRLRLRSADQLRDVASRLRLRSADLLKDVTTRLRLRSADQPKDISTRFLLASASQLLKDIATRLRLRSADQLKNVVTRLRLRSADKLSDIASRFRLRSLDQLKDISTRLKLRSADQLKDVKTRLRLRSADQLRDVASRFRLRSANQLKDVQTRFWQVLGTNRKDVTSRLRLRSADQLRDIATRFILASAFQRIKDVSTRLRLRSADQARDVASRVRVRSADQLRDIAVRLRLMSAIQTKDTSTRIRQMSASQFKNVPARFVQISALQARDIRLRFVLVIYQSHSRDISARFILAQKIMGSTIIVTSPRGKVEAQAPRGELTAVGARGTITVEEE